MTEIIDQGKAHFTVHASVYNYLLRRLYVKGETSKMVDVGMTLIPQPPEELQKHFEKGGALHGLRLCFPYETIIKIGKGELSFTNDYRMVEIMPNETKEIMAEIRKEVDRERGDEEDEEDEEDEIIDLNKIIKSIAGRKSIEYTNHETREYGWLSPDGKFYTCDYMAHDDLAFKMWKAGIVTSPNQRVGDHMVMNLGWLKVSLGYRMSNYSRNLTQRQIDFIYDYLKYNEIIKIEYNGWRFHKHGTLDENYAEMLAYMDRDKQVRG